MSQQIYATGVKKMPDKKQIEETVGTQGNEPAVKKQTEEPRELTWQERVDREKARIAKLIEEGKQA